MRLPSQEHVCLRTQCGICGQAMVAGEAFVPCKRASETAAISLGTPPILTCCLVMGGNSPSQPRLIRHAQDIQPEPAVCLGTFVFPESNTVKTCDTPSNGRICWATRCWRCRQSPQAVGLHADCLRLFRRECRTGDALARLWTVAEFRSPWPNAADLGLDAENGLDVGLVREAARGWAFLGWGGCRRSWCVR